MGTEVGTYRNYVGGQWIDAGAHFDDFNPYSGALVARASAGTRADAAGASAGFGGFQLRRAVSRPARWSPRRWTHVQRVSVQEGRRTFLI